MIDTRTALLLPEAAETIAVFIDLSYEDEDYRLAREPIDRLLAICDFLASQERGVPDVALHVLKKSVRLSI